MAKTPRQSKMDKVLLERLTSIDEKLARDAWEINELCKRVELGPSYIMRDFPDD